MKLCFHLILLDVLFSGVVLILVFCCYLGLLGILQLKGMESIRESIWRGMSSALGIERGRKERVMGAKEVVRERSPKPCHLQV